MTAWISWRDLADDHYFLLIGDRSSKTYNSGLRSVETEATPQATLQRALADDLVRDNRVVRECDVVVEEDTYDSVIVQ